MRTFGNIASFENMQALIDQAQKNARATAQGSCKGDCPVRAPMNQAQRLAESLSLTGIAGVLKEIESNYERYDWNRIATRLFDAKLMAKKAREKGVDIGDPTKGQKDKPLPPAAATQIPPPEKNNTLLLVLGGLLLVGGIGFVVMRKR